MPVWHFEVAELPVLHVPAESPVVHFPVGLVPTLQRPVAVYPGTHVFFESLPAAHFVVAEDPVLQVAA